MNYRLITMPLAVIGWLLISWVDWHLTIGISLVLLCTLYDFDRYYKWGEK